MQRYFFYFIGQNISLENGSFRTVPNFPRSFKNFAKTTPLLPFSSETPIYRAFQDGSSCSNYSRTSPFSLGLPLAFLKRNLEKFGDGSESPFFSVFSRKWIRTSRIIRSIILSQLFLLQLYESNPSKPKPVNLIAQNHIHAGFVLSACQVHKLFHNQQDSLV